LLQENQKYIRMVIQQDESDKLNQAQEEKLAARKRLEVAEIQRN